MAILIMTKPIVLTSSIKMFISFIVTTMMMVIMMIMIILVILNEGLKS